LTHTVQSRSVASLSEAGKDQVTDEAEAEDNMNLLLSVCDSLNNLCDRLSKLDYVLNQKKIGFNGK